MGVVRSVVVLLCPSDHAHVCPYLPQHAMAARQNAELLAGVKEGDIIASAKVLSGLENLKK